MAKNTRPLKVAGRNVKVGHMNQTRVVLMFGTVEIDGVEIVSGSASGRTYKEARKRLADAIEAAVRERKTVEHQSANAYVVEKDGEQVKR